MINIPCVIFAGGKSSRMGEDKSLLPFGEFKTLTQFQINKLQKIFKDVYVSCKDSTKFDFLNENEDVNFIEDVKAENTFAPTAGFVAIFEKLKYEKIFVISVDTPFISKYEIDKIILNDNSNVDATVAKIESGIQPMCGIYHRSLEPKFIQMMSDDNHKLGYLLKNSNTSYVDFKDEKPFLNLNHQYEYKKALSIICNYDIK